jgi:acetyl esterase/lipase
MAGMVGMVDDDSVLSRTATSPDSVRWGAGRGDVADVRTGAGGGAGRALLVMVHGGFWRPAYDRVHVRPMTQALAAAGWTVAAPEYRRVPGDPDATTDDLRSALVALPSMLAGAHDGRVVVLGHSAGGHLALWAAASAPAPGLVGTLALAGVADLAAAEREGLGSGAVEAFLGARAATRPDLDPCLLGSATGRVRLLHGAEDEIVPLRQSEAYAASHAGAALEAVPDTGHFAVIDPASRAWPRVIAAIEDLGSAAPARADGMGPTGP